MDMLIGVQASQALTAVLMLGFVAFGALLVPDVGEVRLLDRALRDSSGEALQLRAFVSNTTPAEGDTAATYTQANGGGYAAIALANATWGAASTSGGVTSSAYPEQTWTFTGPLTTNLTIYGYYVVGAVSGILYWAERAAASFEPASNGDTYKVTPRMEFA